VTEGSIPLIYSRRQLLANAAEWFAIVSSARFYARSYTVSILVIRVGRSLQTLVKMFTDVFRTSAR
jgi:hypothetical protein